MKKTIRLISIILITALMVLFVSDRAWALTGECSLSPVRGTFDPGEQITVAYTVTASTAFSLQARVSCSQGLKLVGFSGDSGYSVEQKMLSKDNSGGTLLTGEIYFEAVGEGDQSVFIEAMIVSLDPSEMNLKTMEVATVTANTSATVHVRTQAEIQAALEAERIAREEAARAEAERQRTAREQAEAAERERQKAEAAEAAARSSEAAASSETASEELPSEEFSEESSQEESTEVMSTDTASSREEADPAGKETGEETERTEALEVSEASSENETQEAKLFVTDDEQEDTGSRNFLGESSQRLYLIVGGITVSGGPDRDPDPVPETEKIPEPE